MAKESETKKKAVVNKTDSKKTKDKKAAAKKDVKNETKKPVAKTASKKEALKKPAAKTVSKKAAAKETGKKNETKKAELKKPLKKKTPEQKPVKNSSKAKDKPVQKPVAEPLKAEPVTEKPEEKKPFYNGQKLKFGKYHNQPILWRVLDYDSRKKRALVLSEEILAWKPYHEISDEEFNDESFKGVSWETATIRSWLNSDRKKDDGFLFQFTPKEKSMIFETLLDTVGCKKRTRDKVFLLSAAEVLKYLPTPEVRIAGKTKEAEAIRIEKVEQEKKKRKDKAGKENEMNIQVLPYWWLRTQGRDAKGAMDVSYTGMIYRPGYDVNIEDEGIRPALWVDASDVKSKYIQFVNE